jgi:hypothetical protein
VDEWFRGPRLESGGSSIARYPERHRTFWSLPRFCSSSPPLPRWAHRLSPKPMMGSTSDGPEASRATCVSDRSDSAVTVHTTPAVSTHRPLGSKRTGGLRPRQMSRRLRQDYAGTAVGLPAPSTGCAPSQSRVGRTESGRGPSATLSGCSTPARHRTLAQVAGHSSALAWDKAGKTREGLSEANVGLDALVVAVAMQPDAGA